MTFHLKVFFTIAAVVVLVSLVEAGFDVAATRGRAWLEVQTERSLATYADSLAVAIDLRGSVPIRAGSRTVEVPRYRGSSYRVTLDGRVLHGERGAFPGGPGWVATERALVGDYSLEAAIQRTALERFVANDLFVDLLDLPLFLALAFVLSWLLARNIIRPVRELTIASEQLSHQQAAEPIAVPAGDDDLSRMARSFNAMSDSIQGYLERERAFTRYASHELRTPLAALRAQVERARLDLVPADEVLPVLERNVRRMEEIIGALLALARSTERDADPVPLSPIVHELIRGLPPEARARVRLDLDAGGPVVVADARLVRQALQNLVQNALRHTAGPVVVGVAVEGDVVVLSVRDRGPGLPEDVAREPERPFARRGTERSGLGLGLSLVAKIAQALNGELDLRNVPDGLQATLTLPVRVDGGPDRRPAP